MHRSRIAIITLGSLALALVGGPVAAQGASPTAAYVTGVIVDSSGTPPEPLEGSGSDQWVMVTEREVDWSDARLPSRMVARTHLVSREGSHPDGTVWPEVQAATYRLDGPSGAWTGVGQGFQVNREWMPEEPAELMGVEMLTLSGEGAYEGLSAILLLHADALDYGQGSFRFEGLIYEGVPPGAPEPVEPGFLLSE